MLFPGFKPLLSHSNLYRYKAGLVGAAVLYAAGVMMAGDSSSSSRQRDDNVVTSTKRRFGANKGDGNVPGQNPTSQLLHALADFGCMINLFNLLPLGSLDGGQVAATLHPSLLVVGCVAGTAGLYTLCVKLHKLHAMQVALNVAHSFESAWFYPLIPIK